jgi:hypothetical protein
MAAGGDERVGRSTLSNRLKNGGDALDVFHEGHGLDHHPNHDRLNHGLGPNQVPNDLQHQGYRRQGFRLDADWGLYGQHGNATKEVMALNKRLEELKKDVDNMMTNRENDNQVLTCFSLVRFRSPPSPRWLMSIPLIAGVLVRG